MNKYTWSTEKYPESWNNAAFETMEECFADAWGRIGENVSSLYIVELAPYLTYGINVDSILEELAQDAYDDMGECAVDWLEDIPIEELDEKLDAVLKEWFKKHGRGPRFCTIENVRLVENKP